MVYAVAILDMVQVATSMKTRERICKAVPPNPATSTIVQIL